MDHLSSCYFCGAALDEPLGAYSLDSSGGGRSVTLCASCRHKLDTLLEANDFDPTVPADETETNTAPSTDAGPGAAGLPAEDSGSPATDEAEGNAAPATVDESGDTERATAATAETEPDPVSEQPPPESEPDGEEESSDTDAGTASAIAPGRVAASGPEPVTTDPDDLPDDKEVNIVPGLAVDADESSEEPTLSEEMEPTVPDAFDDTEQARADDAASTAPNSSTEELGDDSNGDADSPTADTEDIASVESESILSETDGVDTTPIESELTAEDDPLETDDAREDETTLETTDNSADEPAEGGVDPSILQADEIATGEAEVEEVLGDDIDIPDHVGNSAPDDDPEPDEPSGPPPVEDDSESEIAGEDDPFDIDPGDEPPVETEPDDGGFDFDNSPDSDTDEDLQSEMEPDIPEEFSSTAEEIAGGTTGGEDSEEGSPEKEVSVEGTDTQPTEEVAFGDFQQDAVDEPPTVESNHDPEPSPEEIAFGDSQSAADPADDSPAGEDAVEGDNRAPESTPADSELSAGESKLGEAGDPGGLSPEDRRSISALEYNKVMRLLQNREFPVDRMELLAVAASTYDLSQTECEAVLDIAVERGLLAREGNKLVKPE